MSKTLFSLAFLAASGGYVAYANHGLDGVLLPTAGPEEAVALVQPALPSVPPVALDRALAAIDQAPVILPTPAPAAASAIAPSSTIAVSTPPIVAMAAVVAPPPLTPPLPRPRPTNAPTIETAQATLAARGNQYRDGTYNGTSENAYYGRVQVQVTVSGNQITAVTPLDYPADRRTSRYINSQALPMLRQEVMQAQNANIDTISGATLTSEAYIRSLGNALSRAGGGNA